MKSKKAIGALLFIMLYAITFSNIHSIATIEEQITTESVEKILSDHIIFRNSFINLYGLFQKITGVNIIDDKENGYIIRQENGQLVWVGVTKGQIDESSKRLNNMLRFKKYLDMHGMECLYVQMPSKNSPDEMHLPVGVTDHLMELQDYQVHYLHNNGMRVIDLRDEFKHRGYHLEDVFFKTDHHWKPEYAFYANEIITKYIARLGFNINEAALDAENYEIDTYYDWFLGSIGKRVGIYYAGVDYINFIYPKFDTLLSFGERKGAFLDSMIEYSEHCNIRKKNFFNINQYEAYTGGNYPFIEIQNFMPPNQKKVIIIKDSMSNAVIPFLALQCEYLTDIDLRYLTENDMESMKEYVNKFQPDLVIFTTTSGTDNELFIKDLDD